MLRASLYITAFYLNVILSLQREVPLAPLPTPYIHEMSPQSNTELKLYWHPLESPENNPILGYKVIIWEMKIFKNYHISDEYGQIDYEAIDYEKINDIPDYEPVFYRVIPDPKANQTEFENLIPGVYYLIRIQAYSAAGNGPLSEVFGINLD